MKKIVFVCTGNTCRSPMAEVIARNAFKDHGLEIEVFSRGVFVSYEARANEKAIEVTKKFNINTLQNHKAKQIEVSEIDKDTIVLTMTLRHKQYLLMNHPELRTQVFALKEFIGEEGDVEDPYGCSIEIYTQCAKSINNLITKLIKKLKMEGIK